MNIIVPFVWLRLVLNDFSTVYDLPAFAITELLVCERYANLDGRGFRYEQAFFNDGAPTGNPDTTGQQIVLIEKTDAVFADGAEQCWRYTNGTWRAE